MQTYCREVEPSYFPCHRLDRNFPSEWKDVLFRRRSRICADGIYRYQCPTCANEFDHTTIGYLQGDHIWPYSLFGETSWDNYRLICGACNAQKRDFLDH